MMNLELEKVDIGYTEIIISDIHAVLREGEVTLLLGKNGSGKSTLLKTILGIVPPLKGNIKLENKPISAYSRNEISKKIAVVFSDSGHEYAISSKEFILHGRYPYMQLPFDKDFINSSLFNETISYLNLGDILQKPVNELSDGYFQKVSIARAIMQDTDIILMDEPLSHLDSSNQMLTLDILQNLAKAKGKSILFTSHDWSQSIPIADKLWLIKDKKLFTGNTEDLALQENLIENFTQPNYYFDYCYNQFRKKDKTSGESVNIIINDQEGKRVYWLYKALSKKNIDINKDSEISIEVMEESYVLKKNNESKNYNTLYELIENLK